MKILMVTSLSPSRVGLNEYGKLFLDTAANFKCHEFTFAADIDQYLDQSFEPPANIKVCRIWRYNDIFSCFKIAQLALRERPDVVWFNLIITSFGDRGLPAFLGLMTPLMLRVLGFRCVTTLHHLSAFLDFSATRYRGYEIIFKLCGRIAEQLLAWSGPIALLLDKYVTYFKNHYLFSNAVRMHHGFYALQLPAAPKPNKNVLVFGKFGSYKKLDFPIEIFRSLRLIDSTYTMTIAGGSHPSYPGYYESFADQYGSIDGLDFIGYVSDQNLADVFSKAGVVLLPYSSATGVSGVAHLAASACVPVVAAEIEDFVAMAKEEHVGIKFFKPGDLAGAIHSITEIINDTSLWSELSTLSSRSSTNYSIERVFESYMGLFESLVAPKSKQRSRR
jgi:glycosyltransferase involved in cell wall biosynthesis